MLDRRLGIAWTLGVAVALAAQTTDAQAQGEDGAPDARGAEPLSIPGTKALSPVETAEPVVALLWHPGDACIDPMWLSGEVRAQSRRRVVDADAVAEAAAQVHGHARRYRGGWRITLWVTQRDGGIVGQRAVELAGADCAALREHVVLLAVMLVDSREVADAGARAASASATQPVPAPPAPRRPAAPSPAIAQTEVGSLAARREPSGPWGIALFASGAVEVGRLPGTGPGLLASFALESPGGWVAELSAAGFASARASDDMGETALSWRRLALAGCLPRLRRGVAVSACAGVDAGVIDGEGSGFAHNLRRRELLVDLTVAARAEAALAGPAFVRLELRGHLGLLRPRFGYEDREGGFQPLYRPSLGAATLGLGLGVRFP